ncbi:MAG: signal peptidase II [Fusobacterium sp.]|nr:signal peptidase II [Fusobacterium sp.]
MNSTTKTLYFISLFVFLVIVDLFLSNLLVHSMSQGLHFTTPVLKLHYLENTGAAFNILRNAREALIIFSCSAITLLFVYVFKNLARLGASTLFWIAMLCAGTFGNMHERITIGCVRDFFELTFVNFPVFNISDIMINVSVVILVITILFKKVR